MLTLSPPLTVLFVLDFDCLNFCVGSPPSISLLSHHSCFLLLLNPQISLFVGWSMFVREEQRGTASVRGGFGGGILRNVNICLVVMAKVSVGSLVFIFL